MAKSVLRGKGFRMRPMAFSDTALLPWAVGVAEEGRQAELPITSVMLGEFGSVIEGKGSDQSVVERLEPGQEPADGWFGSLARLLGEEKDAGLSLVSGEDGLAIFSKQHEVGLPVSCLPSGIGGLWPQRDGHTVFDKFRRGPAWTGPSAALVFLSGQIEPPGAVIGAADLGVDEAVNGLIADAARRL